MVLAFRSFISVRRQIHLKRAVIQKATESDRKDVSRLMQDVFYKTDPSSVYSKVSESSSVSPIMQEMSLESLEEGLSFIAKVEEQEKIVGTAINGTRPAVLKANFMESLLNKVESKREKTLLELWKFISLMPPDSEKYFEGGERLFEIRFLVVDPEFRNRGIATDLVNNSIKEAAAKGHKFVRIDCTSHFTARIASAAGMDCIYEINYADYKGPNGEHVFQNITLPHTKVAVFAKKES